MVRERATLLLVEDNAADAAMLLELLEEQEPPPEVIHVGTGERALAHLHGQVPGRPLLRPDLVILDLKLPGRSGLEILSAIREAPTLRRLPVVILSTSNAPRDIDACYAAGANAYLVKSSNIDELSQKLKTAVSLFYRIAERPTPPDHP